MPGSPISRGASALVLALLLFTAGQSAALSQDKEGCKDHPFFTRMPGFFIEDCTENYNQLDFVDAAGNDVQCEGNLTVLKYTNTGATKSPPSTFQILRNYDNAVARMGGKKVSGDGNFSCYELRHEGTAYKVKVCCFGTYSDYEIVYELDVLAMETMKQDISANEMASALNAEGHVALNILFETGQAVVQQESLPILDQICAMLRDNPSLKIAIEGHTDNVGSASDNKTLSLARAKAVLDALIAKGIEKSRLSYAGWGQEKPVADNGTEDGRARNRRVEIVKQ